MNFTEEQFKVIESLTDGIFPATEDTPSATELMVPYMIVDVAQGWDEATFNATAAALDAINDISLESFSFPIYELLSDELAILIEVVSTDPDLQPFWVPFRVLVALNYYALPTAYTAIGMPGPSIDHGGFTPDGYPT
jgi:hypothetical protein